MQQSSHSVENGQLWTTKYAPKIYSDIIGNKAVVTSLVTWLRNYGNSTTTKKTIFRGALLSGPPGIGKTTCAHLVASKENFTILEFNASDTRSKKLLDIAFRESTKSHAMTKFMEQEEEGPPQHDRTVIIMDEVDGMSSGDRGGLTELVQLMKKSQVPIICICNDRNESKMKTLAQYCLDLRFQKPTASAIQGRVLAIAKLEGLTLTSKAIQELVQRTGSDIRQILNLLSLYRQGDLASKDVPPANVFTATERLLTASTWRSDSLTEKMQHYFDDSSMMPLMIQESYVRTNSRMAQLKGGKDDKKKLEHSSLLCIAAAADSISLGDTVDKQLRVGQNWSLMPIHNVMSTVRPCLYTHGQLRERVSFPSWFPKNSTATKMNRLLSEVQTHMQPRISGSKKEVRSTYLSTLGPALVKPLLDEGKSGIAKVVSLMGDYGLTREDWNSIQELRIPSSEKGDDKTIPAATKAALTRAYNKVNPSCESKTSARKHEDSNETDEPEQIEVEYNES